MSAYASIPTITIITVVYNGEDTIESTIQSVIDQSYSNLKYIVIDGNSTDGTINIIERYSEKIFKWISEPDDGIYDAMNKGWALADKDSYILYLGSGDKIIHLPERLDTNMSCVYFGDAILGYNGVFKVKTDFRLKIGNTVHHQALLIPKKLHPQPPFNIKYKVYADFDFNQRLQKLKIKFIKTNQLRSFVLPDGYSQHYKTREWFYIIKNNYGLFYAILGFMYNQYQALRKKLKE